TSAGKRVGIACANEDPRGDKYWLGLRDDQPDIVVLLCRSISGRVFDFVLPPQIVQNIWSQLPRSNTQFKIHVNRHGPKFELVDAPRNLKLISQYLSRHELLR